MIIAIVIVIYNHYIEQYYKKYKKILNYRANEVYFIDNSDNIDIQAKNLKYCRKFNLSYHSMSGNKGLSAAYNQALNNIPKASYVVFLDDDTEITQEYFDFLYSNLDLKKDVYIPYIEGQNKKIYSPNEAGYFKNKLIKFGQIPSHKINGIMSCTAIKYALIQEIRFDERLFVDQVDQLLFDKLRHCNAEIKILDVIVKQNFHQRGKIDSQKGWNRLEIRLRDLNAYYQLSNYSQLFKIVGKMKGVALGIQMSLNCKSPCPVFNAIKYELHTKI